MKYLKTFQELNEDINIPVNIGDTIYQGRFKNKKTIVKEIGEDETGMPTINKKKVVNFRTTPPKKTKFKGKPYWLRFRKKKEE
jgi:hypothetical protein